MTHIHRLATDEKLRDDAATVCSAMACWCGMRLGDVSVFEISDELGFARDVAITAWDSYLSIRANEGPDVRWAETECLLRTGWEPS